MPRIIPDRKYPITIKSIGVRYWLHFLLMREGLAMNQKRFRRLYREERLQVRKRSGRKRALGLRAPLAPPSRPNERWSLDVFSAQRHLISRQTLRSIN